MGAMDEAFTPTQQDILAALFNAVNVVSGHAARQSDGGHTMLGVPENFRAGEPEDASPARRGVSLLRPRRDLDPCLWARRSGRIVGPNAGTVVPVRLRRSRWLHVHRWFLNDDWGRSVGVVGRRVIPPVRIRRTPPE